MLRLYLELSRVAVVCRQLELTRGEFEQLPAHVAEGLLVVHQAREDALAQRLKDETRGFVPKSSARR